MFEEAAGLFQRLQDEICAKLTEIDEKQQFHEDRWQREGGGGGKSRVLADGGVFEKAGVNFSEVFGELPEDFAKTLPGEGTQFRAAGVSLVLHPRNPFVPTTHANFRYIEKGGQGWFGGGADLTPYYFFRDDAVHFHTTLKTACDAHNEVANYQEFKEWCDRYFFLPHRGETRGVGGVFYDYLKGDDSFLRSALAFSETIGRSFLTAYVPIVERHKDDSYSDPQRHWQLQRRGRYVEFNLLYDRGTVFGLKTNGRVESILMSLPPQVRWDYNVTPAEGSPEAEMVAQLIPQSWV